MTRELFVKLLTDKATRVVACAVHGQIWTACVTRTDTSRQLFQVRSYRVSDRSIQPRWDGVWYGTLDAAMSDYMSRLANAGAQHVG